MTKHTLIEITCPECGKAIEVSNRIKWVIREEREDERNKTLEEVLKDYKRWKRIKSSLDSFDRQHYEDYGERLEQKLRTVSS